MLNAMKKTIVPLLLSALVVLGGMFTGCSESDDPKPKDPVAEPVTLTLSLGEITSNSAKVNVVPSDTGKYYVTLLEAGTVEGKSASQIADSLIDKGAFVYGLQRGEKSVYFSSLKGETAYVAVAFGWNGEKRGEVAQVELTTADEPREQVVSHYLDVDYWADIYHNGFCNYVVFMGDAPHKSVNIQGLGDIYTFSIYTKEFPANGGLAPLEGTYTLLKGNPETPEDFCMEQGESQFFTVKRFVSAQDYTLEHQGYTDATLTIQKNADGTYTAEAKIDQEDGTRKTITYTGEMGLNDRSFKGYNGPTLEENLDFVADYTAGYYGTGTAFEIMDGGHPDADGAEWNNRHRLAIALPAVVDEATGDKSFPEGTFEVSNVEGPGVVAAGKYVDLGGGAEGAEGTYYYFLDSKWKSYYAFVQRGSVTITKNEGENNYTIQCDFTVQNGHTIKAVYSGQIPTPAPAASAPGAHKMPKPVWQKASTARLPK